MKNEENLIMTTTPTKAVLAARAIRKDLKIAYPDIKFSVSVRKRAEGDAIDIAWLEGPRTEHVRERVSECIEVPENMLINTFRHVTEETYKHAFIAALAGIPWSKINFK